MAAISLADMTIHVDETLDKDARAKLEQDLRALEGVVSACSSEHTPHLVTVIFDPKHARSKDVLKVVLGEHLHAELVGL